MNNHSKLFSYWRFLSAAILSVLLSSSCFAIDFSQLYSRQDLTRIQQVYGKNIRAVLFEDIRNYLTLEERKTLSSIKVDIPLYTDNAGLFDFSMDLNTGKMTISALSVKFLDDLAIAFAWYEYKKLDKQKIIDYVFRLYTNPEQMQPPLPSLGVPDKAWKVSDYVDDVSQKILKSAIAFLLLHEFAHWHYQHSPYDLISNRMAQKQEKQSDAFALNVMARMHTIPYGMVTWFMVTGLLQSNEARTHPLSSNRLIAIARRLEQDPAKFIGQENVDKMTTEDVKRVGREIKSIASLLDK